MTRTRVAVGVVVLVVAVIGVASTNDMGFVGGLLFSVSLGMVVLVAARAAQRKGRGWALFFAPFGFAPALFGLGYGLGCDYHWPSPACDAVGYGFFPALFVCMVALLVSVAAALLPVRQKPTCQGDPGARQVVIGAVLVCWNCEAVVRGLSDCPYCMAGLHPEGRGMTPQQFCREQRLLKDRLGVAGSDVRIEDLELLKGSSPPMNLPKAMAGMIVLVGMTFVGEMIGNWYGEILQLSFAYVLLLAFIIYISWTASPLPGSPQPVRQETPADIADRSSDE